MLPSVGVVDTGESCGELISALKAAGFTVSSLWGCTQHQAKTMAHRYDIGYSTSKIDELLLREDVDLVVILCPPHQRAEVAVKALSIGKHVLCEAPSGLSREEADRMVSAAQYYPRLLSIMKHELRFVPTFIKMKQLIEDGYCGRLLVCDCHLDMGSLLGISYDWTCDQAMGGGILTKYGCHIIDIVSFMTNQRAVSVNGTLKTFITQTDTISSFRHITSDDFCTFQMVLSDGAFVTVTLNSHSSSSSQTITVNGTNGQLVSTNERLVGTRDGEEEEFVIDRTANIKEMPLNTFHFGLEALVKEIKRAFEESVDKEDRRNADLQAIASAASFEDGLYTRSVMDAIITSSRKGCWVNI
ncbi:predicted protein, partial [Nematostella vectensis]